MRAWAGLSFEPESEEPEEGSGLGLPFFDDGESSGMMVELEKQVHLQKVVGAVMARQYKLWCEANWAELTSCQTEREEGQEEQCILPA